MQRGLLAGQRHAAAQIFHPAADNGQSDAHVAALTLVEAVKDMRQLLVGDARPVVLYLYDDTAITALQRDLYIMLGIAGAVGDDILKYADQQLRVGADVQLRIVSAEYKSPAVCISLKYAQLLLDELTQRDGYRMELKGAAVHAGEHQYTLDEIHHPLAL